MKREDALRKLFEAEFCEPKEKAVKEREFEETLLRASQETGKPLYVLKPALLKVYHYCCRSAGRGNGRGAMQLKGSLTKISED